MTRMIQPRRLDRQRSQVRISGGDPPEQPL